MRFTSSAAVVAALVFGMAARAQERTPVVFVHGNGDDATKWIPVIWLFESNGYPANRLFAIRLTDPVARLANSRPEPFRSSTTDQASELSAYVARVLLETGARKVALVGSSRGGLTIRNYLKNAGGAAVVSHAILCGTPNHGVMATDANADSEFNGKGTFLRGLNDGSEVVEGVHVLTLRSDKLDKYAQATGAEAPELKGAKNVTLPGLDHREVAFHPAAFEQMWLFLTGKRPERMEAAAEATPAISGLVTGCAGAAATNRPMAGVRLRVFALRNGSAERDGNTVLETTTDETGRWGPARVRADTGYEFVLEQDGRVVSYFLSGLIRSTTILNFRFLTPAAAQALSGGPGRGGQLTIHRPQGYLARGRDELTVDGAEAEGLVPGVPTRDSVTIPVAAAKRSGVRVELRGEVVYARPADSDTALSVVELLHE